MLWLFWILIIPPKNWQTLLDPDAIPRLIVREEIFRKRKLRTISSIDDLSRSNNTKGEISFKKENLEYDYKLVAKSTF